jgi:hypothetical protein
MPFPHHQKQRSGPSRQASSIALGPRQQTPASIADVVRILVVVWAPVVGCLIVALVRIATSIITNTLH